MKVRDFLLQTRVELNEKAEFWKDEEMLIKLQRSYISLQFDLPFFIIKETLVVQSGTSDYYLAYEPLKNVQLIINGAGYSYFDEENFYLSSDPYAYTFSGDMLMLKTAPISNGTGEIVYKYAKAIINENCTIDIPSIHHKALRLMFMSEIHEKPTRNTKERNLNLHYLKLYDAELKNLRFNKKLRPRNITSNYQRC